MFYLMKPVIWLAVIVFISWLIHNFAGEVISNKKVKPFVGIVIFLVTVLTPLSITKVAQVYYCWKYQPFYGISKPLGDDFHGYFQEHSSIRSLLEIIKKHGNNIDFIDTINVKLPVLDENGSVEEPITYIRRYIDNNTSSNCVFPPRDYSRYQNKKLVQGKKLTLLDEVYEQLRDDKESIELKDLFLKEGKCIAEKVIPESEVSRYKFEGEVNWYVTRVKDLEHKRLFSIPGVASVYYRKSPVFTDRITGEPYAWGEFISGGWDLYGSFWKGENISFYCSYDFNLKDKLIKQAGEKNGN